MKKLGSISTRLSILMVSLLALSSCEDKPKIAEHEDNHIEETPINDNAVTQSVMKVEGEIFSIPSPVQTAILIRSTDIPYNEEVLSDMSKAAKVLERNKQALSLGVCGADLAYLSNYGNTQLKLDYFKALEELSSNLGIRSSFDQVLLDRFASNLDSPDSLYQLNAELFSAADRFLKKNKEDEIAALILAGGWIEAMHIAMDAAKSNDKFRARLGEQKVAVESLRELLSKYTNSEAKALLGMFNSLSSHFRDLEVTYTYVKPITDPSEKTTYLNSQSHVKVSDEQLERIGAELNNIRNYITKQ